MTDPTRRKTILGFAVLMGMLLGGGRGVAATSYVFATFKGDDAAGMKLSIYTSTDSVTFTLLSDTGFGGNTNYIRDPSVMRYSDGKYYLAYTDPMTASCCNPEDHFGIAVSSDLIHWTDLTTVKAGVPAVSRVWAPEWFIEGGVVRVIANIDTGAELPDFQPYVFTALDSTLASWSGPAALGIGANYIDTTVAHLGSTYHAFVKNDTTRFLEHATASSLTGPWTFVGKGDWAGWGSGMEGPTIVRLDDGKYRMYVDPQSGGLPCQTMTSSDLNTWSAKANIPNPAGSVVRHGTVIRDVAGPGSNGDFSSAGGAAGTGGSSGAGGLTGSGGSADAAVPVDAGVKMDAAASDASPGDGGGSGTGPSGAGGSTNTGGSANTNGGGATGGASFSGGAMSLGGGTGLGGAPGSGGIVSSDGTSGISPPTGPGDGPTRASSAAGCGCGLAAATSTPLSAGLALCVLLCGCWLRRLALRPRRK